MPFSFFCKTPHDVDAHGEPSNAYNRDTSSSMHQPRSWSKATAFLNICCMSVTLSTAQPLMSWLKADAYSNIPSMFTTL